MLGPNSVVTRRPGAEASRYRECDQRSKSGLMARPSRRCQSRRPPKLISARVRGSCSGSPHQHEYRGRHRHIVDYRIKIDVADEAELAAWTKLFFSTWRETTSNASDVMRFSNETDGLANFYRDGLASYVLGVFAKDNSAASDDPRVLERALRISDAPPLTWRTFHDRPCCSSGIGLRVPESERPEPGRSPYRRCER